MRVALLTREFPPEVYGGAGVHVAHLARELAAMVDVEVHCIGDERPAQPGMTVRAVQPWDRLRATTSHDAALDVMSADLAMAAGVDDVDLVHSHTWYTNLAGHLVKTLRCVPHVATVHSLEPLRPWKSDQLGRGYALSCLCERTGIEGADAVIAVSNAMADDVVRCYPAAAGRIHVIHHGVDTGVFAPDPETDVLQRFGIDPLAPTVLFVGRITTQKGLPYLLEAAEGLDPDVQLVLRAGPADTPALAREAGTQIAAASAHRRVVWIEEELDGSELAQLFTHADVFACPSVYEPFGLVNVEAMACETPVVASAVGGIRETVVDGVTGLLVPFRPHADDPSAPHDRREFVAALREALTELLEHSGRALDMGRAGRKRVLEEFSWTATATVTTELYRALTATH